MIKKRKERKKAVIAEFHQPPLPPNFRFRTSFAKQGGGRLVIMINCIQPLKFV